MRKVRLAFIVALMATVAFVLVDWVDARYSRFVGAVLLASGIPLLLLARAHLGRAFAISPRATVLVTRGVYAKIPHPMYTFLDVALLGLVVLLRLPWLVGAWLVLIAAHTWAARREARVLKAAFGDAYVQYRARTWW